MTLRSAKELLGYKVAAGENEAGYLHDIYFDDKIWVIRHFVVDLEERRPGRKVLISPEAVGQPDWETESLSVKLNLNQLAEGNRTQSGDSPLRSLAKTIGYGIQANDGEGGHLEDFILDDRLWTIRYVIVETQSFWPHKPVSLIPQWVKAINWRDSKIQVSLSRSTIENCPEYFASFYTKQAYAIKFYHYQNNQPHLTLIPA